MQYIKHSSAAATPVVTYVPVNMCTFRITETAVTFAGNSGTTNSAVRKVTHFSPNVGGAPGAPTIPAAVLATGIGAQLGYFNRSGHFIAMTEISVGP